MVNKEKTIFIQANVNIDALLKRAEILIGDGDFKKADILLENVLNNDPLNSDAYLLKSLIALKASSVEDLKKDSMFENESNFKKAYKYANEQQKVKLDELIISSKEFNKQKIYKEAINLVSGKELTLENENDFYLAIAKFSQISGFKDVDALKIYYKRLINDWEINQARINQELIEQRTKRRKKTIKIILFSTVSVILIVAILLISLFYIAPEIRQKFIIISLNSKDYDTALSYIDANGDYGDTENLRLMYYAGQSFEKNNYEEGIDYISLAGGDVDVTYDANGGFYKSSENIKFAKHINNEPVKNGFTFASWVLTSYSLDSAYHHASLKLKAIYDVNTYNISYILNGGTNDPSNPSSYTIESSDITLLPATKTGYTFVGWNDGLSNITSINKGSIGDLTLTAQWAICSYDISYDLQGGTIEKQKSTYTVEDSIELPRPTREGYSFHGWTGSNGNIPQKDVSIYEGSSGDKFYQANWDPVKYKITYNLDGGTNDPSNPSSYNIESSDITLLPATKTGYKFVGWSDGSSIIKSINKGSCGDLALTAQWLGDKQNLMISTDSSMGSVSILGEGRASEEITVVANPNSDCMFKGWYSSDGDLLANTNEYTFIMPLSDLTLEAKFITQKEYQESLGIEPVIDSANKTLTYGLYPQKHVSDSKIIASLNALTVSEKNGWYLLNGEYYAKIFIGESKNSFDDGTLFTKDTHWFKCEPISWKILLEKNGAYSLVSSLLLDAHRFDDGSNNYENSEIREWLNDDFYNTAFSLSDSLIEPIWVDNSALTTDSNSNSYSCNNTYDKVYLLSFQEYENTSYFANNDARTCLITDWANANGSGFDTAYTRVNKWGFYWTRSPVSIWSDYVWHVNYKGEVTTAKNDYANYSYVFHKSTSVRPAITIKVL